MTGRSGGRYLRTTILGILAMAALIWAAMDQFDVDRQQLVDMFLSTLLVVALVIAAAGGVVLLWIGLRKLLRRNSR